jgi:hypothetical protein
MAIYVVNGDSDSNFFDAQFRQLNAGSNALSMSGTVQKKLARAKLFLLTQHQQIFCPALKLAQAQSRSRVASAKTKFALERFFVGLSLAC